MPKAVKPGERLRARLVSDLRGINKKFKRSFYPNEGSQALLKMLNCKHQVFACLDFSPGYHQCILPEEDRDRFAILLPQGKFCYCRWAQGFGLAIDRMLQRLRMIVRKE